MVTRNTFTDDFHRSIRSLHLVNGSLLVLKRLIKEEWTTNTGSKTPVKAFNFRGFYGKYKISYTAGGKPREIVLPLHENGVKEYRLEAEPDAPKEIATD